MTASTHAIAQYEDKADRLAARLAIHKYSTNGQGWFDWLASQLDLTDKHVLEIGAGTGQLWQHLPLPKASTSTDTSTSDDISETASATRSTAPQHGAPASLTVTDFSPAMVAQLRASPHLRTATVQQCDATQLPFPAARFDLVIANHMLYHVDEPARALAEFARVLRPRTGRLVLCLNGRDHLEELLQLGARVGRTSQILGHASVTAETAAALLGEQFVDVVAVPSPGAFEAPHAGPIVAYLNSWGEQDISAEQEQQARAIVDEKIRQEGIFRVKKSMILFTARKA